MRLCMGSIRSLGSVVMMVKLSTLPPSCLRHTSHNPSKGERLLTLEMNPHRHLPFSLFAPLIEPISRNNATASIYEKFERRQLGQCFGTGVYHSAPDTGVCGPMRNQSPMHKPALVTAPASDNHGNRWRNLFGGNIKARRVLW